MNEEEIQIRKQIKDISELLKTSKKALTSLKAQLIVTRNEKTRKEIKKAMHYVQEATRQAKKTMVELKQLLLELENRENYQLRLKKK